MRARPREYPDLPLNEAIRQVTETTERQFHEDVAALGCLPPTVEPRATEHIDEMRALIERLVARGVAYVAEDHVLFSRARWMPDAPRYGSLASRSLDEMLAGARVDVAPYKRDPMDFVLWKPSKPGEPAWPIARRDQAARAARAGTSNARRCRWRTAEPRRRLLRRSDELFDIHGGGIDLVFPHHENEIAQSCCAFDTPVHGECLDAQRLSAGRRREDVEERSATSSRSTSCCDRAFGGRAWPGEVLRLAMLQDPLSPADRLDGRGSRGGARRRSNDWYEVGRATIDAEAPCRGRAGRARATISTRRRRSPHLHELAGEARWRAKRRRRRSRPRAQALGLRPRDALRGEGEGVHDGDRLT